MAEIDLNTVSPRRFGCLLSVLAAVLLGGGVFIYLSAVNASRMALELDDEGRLTVTKGAFLPWGEASYEPSPAFAPLVLPEGFDAEERLELGPCDGAEVCERRFYESVLAMTGALVSERPDEARLERAKELIVRAQIFPNIPLSERGPIEDLTGAIHYVEALVLLDGARSDLEAARRKLERSRIAQVPFVRDEALLELLRVVEAQLELHREIERIRDPALREAL